MHSPLSLNPIPDPGTKVPSPSHNSPPPSPFPLSMAPTSTTTPPPRRRPFPLSHGPERLPQTLPPRVSPAAQAAPSRRITPGGHHLLHFRGPRDPSAARGSPAPRIPFGVIPLNHAGVRAARRGRGRRHRPQQEILKAIVPLSPWPPTSPTTLPPHDIAVSPPITGPDAYHKLSLQGCRRRRRPRRRGALRRGVITSFISEVPETRAQRGARQPQGSPSAIVPPTQAGVRAAKARPEPPATPARGETPQRLTDGHPRPRLSHHLHRRRLDPQLRPYRHPSRPARQSRRRVRRHRRRPLVVDRRSRGLSLRDRNRRDLRTGAVRPRRPRRPLLLRSLRRR